MKHLSVLLVALAALASLSDAALPMSYPVGAGFKFDISTSIPLAKVVESVEPGATVDARAMIGFGGGLTFYREGADGTKVVSLNVPILALSAREGDPSTLDLTLIADVGVIDNRLRLGVGYECGKLAEDRSRWIAVFSVGTNLFE